MDKSITFSAIAAFLKKELYGECGNVETYSSLADIKPCSLVFIKKFDEEFVSLINMASVKQTILAIVTSEYLDKLECAYILSDNPRLDYLRVIQHYFVKNHFTPGVHPSVIVGKNVSIGKGVFIGANCCIGDDVTIGNNTCILPNVVIMDNTSIGEDCYIKSGVVIGQPGFGFEKDESGIPVHFPHLGRVKIGNHVYIGANTAIDKGTLDATIIGDYVKIDNLVHIAHNVVIDDCSYVIAGTIVGGGVHIGRNCWIAPNVSIKQQLCVEDNALIGLGAVVLKDVEMNSIVAGNPAKVLKKSI